MLPARCGGALFRTILVAGDLIASFFATAAQSGQSYDTVLFVGTMHYPGSSEATTTLSGWRTAFGTVENVPKSAGCLRKAAGWARQTTTR
jgi:predicted class III extradiol MEMO1 family dioxygenase